MTFEKEPVIKPESPKNTPKKKVPKKKVPKKKPVDIVEEPVQVRNTDEVNELHSSLRLLDLPDEPRGHQTMCHSFSTFERGSIHHIPEQEGFVREDVDLRHAEIMKHEYGWSAPDWIDAQLRPTSHGKLMKERGDIASPVTNAKVLVEKGLVVWQTPVWANAKLRKTPRGEEIMRRASLNGQEAFAGEHI